MLYLIEWVKYKNKYEINNFWVAIHEGLQTTECLVGRSTDVDKEHVWAHFKSKESLTWTHFRHKHAQLAQHKNKMPLGCTLYVCDRSGWHTCKNTDMHSHTRKGLWQDTLEPDIRLSRSFFHRTYFQPRLTFGCVDLRALGGSLPNSKLGIQWVHHLQ